MRYNMSVLKTNYGQQTVLEPNKYFKQNMFLHCLFDNICARFLFQIKGFEIVAINVVSLTTGHFGTSNANVFFDYYNVKKRILQIANFRTNLDFKIYTFVSYGNSQII